MDLCFSGEFQSARPAILSLPFCGASTVGALGRESFAYSWHPSAVYVFVAGLAQGNAVGYIVAQFLMVFPRLDVVCLNSADRAALLAGVIVSLVDRITPLAILIGIALLVDVLFALGCVAAILTAIFGFKLSVGWMKRFAAPLASDECLRSINGVALIGALDRTKPAATSYIAERFTAHGASDSKAIVAFSCVWILGDKWFPALLAYAFGRLEQRRFAISHSSYYTPACAILQALERWSVHTGKTPVLVDI